jgi:acetylornithine deacetylase/succinyl-diaminopimelate desuccinylase-like protein
MSTERPQEIPVHALPLNKEKETWYRNACDLLDEERLTNLLRALTDIHSPTGAEGELAGFITSVLKDSGFQSYTQTMTPSRGNAIGRLRGSGGGASLLLYEPIDTHMEATTEADLPWAGEELRPDMLPKSQLIDGLVVGLGASNPKAMVATMIEVGRSLKEAEIPLLGDLILGFAGGGMPWSNSRRGESGLSDGVTYMLHHGVSPDFAVVMKPWNAVYYEEAGLCWFRVSVKGTYGYAGIPHNTPGWDNSVVAASKVILALQDWLPAYVKKNTSGQIEPWGWISAVHGGWKDKPAFPTALTEILIDLRITPRTSPAEVERQFGEAINAIRARYPEIEMKWEMFGATPSGSTDPENWIIQSAMRAWERVEEKKHGASPLMAGQTDGAALRHLGIPTARLGWPWPYEDGPRELSEGLGGMGVTYIPDLVVCAKKIIYVAIDTLTRDRRELGL